MEIRSPLYEANKKAWRPWLNIIGFGIVVTLGILLFVAVSVVALAHALRAKESIWLGALFFAFGTLLTVKVLPACYRQAQAELRGRFSLEADDEELRISGLSDGVRHIPWHEINFVGIGSYYIGCTAVVIHHRKELAFGITLPPKSQADICEWIIAAQPKIQTPNQPTEPTAGLAPGRGSS
jgi:membrane protein YdbS with pleckstrin-like domain